MSIIRNHLPTRDTRLRKLDAVGGPHAAIVVATAGLKRLGQHGRITERLSPTQFPYAVGQGALGVEVRKGDDHHLRLLSSIETDMQRWTCLAERSLLRTLQGGCSSPVDVASIIKHSDGEAPNQDKGSGIKLQLHGFVFHSYGLSEITASAEAVLKSDDDAEVFGGMVALALQKSGASELLAKIRTINDAGFKEDTAKRLDAAQLDPEHGV